MTWHDIIFIKQIRIITAIHFHPPNEVSRYDEKHSRQWQSTKYPFCRVMPGLACTSDLMNFLSAWESAQGQDGQDSAALVYSVDGYNSLNDLT